MNTREKKVLENSVVIAEKISQEHKLIYCANDFYEYADGCYRKQDIKTIQKYIKEILGYTYKTHKASEIIEVLGINSHIEIDKLNDTKYLNLKNGLFDLETETLNPHTPDVYSTIQLNVAHKKETLPKKWVNTVYEIFEWNENKVTTLQEYFGLCLTKEVKYEKALFMLGEGSNGKSTLLYILENLIGDGNRTAIPLEKLNNSHYIANLFNKLVNVSIETNAKSEVYDAVFKAIVSGDSIEADAKFKAPFHFRPYCKLIFALNNMPRVDDKTASFFRRLLILRFNKQFNDDSANKNLKYELLGELDGIFLWCLEGLRNLRKRGYFAIDDGMKTEIDGYKRENNNVMMFVDDECIFDVTSSATKPELYESYTDWCKTNGYRPLSKNKFGKELLKQYPQIEDGRVTDSRLWRGISTNKI